VANEREQFKGWAVVEIKGFRSLVGFVTECELAGCGMLRVDVPGDEAKAFSQYINPSSLHVLTPISEEAAREYLRRSPPPAPCVFSPVVQRSLPGPIYEDE
jgi:hypothetical protein